MSSVFGRVFRISTFGESHGPGLGVTIDGCPPKFPLDVAAIQKQLERRRPGQNALTTQRKEPEKIEILSGLFEGVTLGTPIAMLVRNKDSRSEHYKAMEHIYRPSHADLTYDAKYGYRTWQGGGRASARETVARVAAGAVAEQILAKEWGVEIIAYVRRIHKVSCELSPEHLETVTREAVDSNIVRCPEESTWERMADAIDTARRGNDSVGGVVECVVRKVPPGLGAPVFDKLEADLAKAMLSIPAAKGFEVGSGFEGTLLTGSEHNDPFVMKDGVPRTTRNFSGGIQGGISNGEPIVFRVALKPTATIGKEQQTVTDAGEETTLAAKGRHDPCVVPRAIPIVEAMAALVLLDHALVQLAQCGEVRTLDDFPFRER